MSKRGVDWSGMDDREAAGSSRRSVARACVSDRASAAYERGGQGDL